MSVYVRTYYSDYDLRKILGKYLNDESTLNDTIETLFSFSFSKDNPNLLQSDFHFPIQFVRLNRKISFV